MLLALLVTAAWAAIGTALWTHATGATSAPSLGVGFALCWTALVLRVGIPPLRSGATYAVYAAAPCVAWSLGVHLQYAVAIVAAPLLWAPLEFAARAGLVRYDMTTLAWGVRRACLYASIRALAARLVHDARIAVLVPVGIATLETVGMVVASAMGRGFPYTFPVCSADFAIYATLKTATFLCVPFAEDALLA